jgi:hypothetical protein
MNYHKSVLCIELLLATDCVAQINLVSVLYLVMPTMLPPMPVLIAAQGKLVLEPRGCCARVRKEGDGVACGGRVGGADYNT